MDSAIFPNPESYDPDRWIRAAQEGVRLDRYFVSFSKGSRMCVGIKYVVEFSPPPFPIPVPIPSAVISSPSPSKKPPAHVNIMRSLAYAELYLTLATILSRFELENYETTTDDVAIHRDFFVGVPKEGSKG